MTDESLYEARDFDAFWRIYVSLHSRPATRAMHCLATTAMMLCVARGLHQRRLRWLLAAPLVDYAIAQTSHRLLEHNRTQPYRNPPWHLRAELRMWWLTISGGMDAEIERLGLSTGPRGTP